MNKTELQRRTKIITALMAIWNCSGNENMITSYVATTKDVPVDLLDAACKKVSAECESRPVPATIIKAAKSLQGEVNGTNFLPFPDVWEEIIRELHDNFVYGEPKFSRTEIKELVNAFGWQELCEMRTSDIPIIRAQLKKMYEDICERKKEKDVNAYVLGTAVLIDSGDTVRLMLK